MNIEIRSDTEAFISGYVNVTEKRSRPVITPHGRVVEIIEPRAFAGAIERADNITLNVDHDKGRTYAGTADGSLRLTEDAIGLRAETTIRDPALVEDAREGRIRGWSFGMYHVQDDLEPRADDLPIRHIRAMDLDHVSLIVHQTPVYSATSVEVRADETEEVWSEARSFADHAEVVDKRPVPEETRADDGSLDRARRRIQLVRAQRR